MALESLRATVAFGALMTFASAAYPAAITITTNTNWSAITTGTGTGGQPGPGDTITVKNGRTLTVNVTNGQAGAITLGGGNPSGGQGTLSFSASTSQVTLTNASGQTGTLILGGGGNAGNLNMANGGTLTLRGFTSNTVGTFNRGTGTVVLTANNTLPTAAAYNTFNNLTVSAGTTTLGQNLTAAGNLNIAGGALSTSTRTLAVSGNMTVTGTATLTNTTTITGTTTINGTLSITSSTGNKTFVGDVTINSGGNWSNTVAGNIFIQGNFTNNGSLASGTATYTFNGSAAQTFTGTVGGATSFALMTLNNANGLSLIGNTHSLTVTTLLTLAAGKIVTDVNTVYISNGSAISGATTGRFIEGNLRKPFSSANPTRAFEVGGNAGTNYAPLSLTFASVTTAGDVTVSSTATTHPQLSTSGLDTATPALLNRYWTIANNSVGFTTYSATFTYPSTEIDPAANATTFLAVRYNAGFWYPTTLSGTPTTTSLGITSETAFGDFAIGNSGAVVSGVGRFNAYDPSPLTPTGSAIGNIRTKIAGQQFTLTIVHLNNKGDAVSNMNDTFTADLIDASATGGTFTNNCSSNWTSPPITTVAGSMSGGNYSATVNFTVADAYPNVRVRVTRSGGTEIGCSTDNFAIRPESFTLEALDADWQTAGTARLLYDPSGVALAASINNVHAASTSAAASSRPFTLRATAKNAASAVTANYSGTLTVVSGPTCVLPSGCGTGSFEFGTWSAASGVLTTTAYYSEAGTFVVELQDSTFADVDAADTALSVRAIPQRIPAGSLAALEIGRFVPDRFVFSGANTPVLQTFGSACTSRTFTYVGQPFWFTVPPSATISAVNAAGVVTTNYQGALFKLTGAGVAETYGESTAGRPALSCKLTSDLSTACTSTNAAAPTITPLTGANAGKATYAAAATGASLVYARSTATPTAPYDAKISLTVVATDNGENAISGNPGNGATATLTTPSPFVFDNAGNGILFDGNDFNISNGLTGGKTFVYGRLRMENGFGSPSIALPVGMQTQYWNGAAFLTNNQDQCTTLGRTNITLSDYRVNLSACETAVVQGTVTFTNGTGQLYLAAPGIAALTGGPAGTPAVGSVLVTPNLATVAAGNYCPAVGGAETPAVAASKSYLQGAWTGASYTENPSARATFGLYGAQPKNFIFFRENY